MQYLARQYEPAQELTAQLLQKDPRNGDYQRLNALILAAALSADAPPERIAKARDAWGTMLRDPGLRSTAPERYWEARYHYLALMLRGGAAEEVEKAIRQERIWYPDLGGVGWKEKFDELHHRAAEQSRRDDATSKPATSQPGAPTPAPRALGEP
jgi:hypothetical protein